MALKSFVPVRALLAGFAVCGVVLWTSGLFARSDSNERDERKNMEELVHRNAARMIAEGRHTFRYDTFGDEAFWGDTLKLHQAIAGAKQGGVGPGVSPASALAVGLKVDVDALPDSLRSRIAHGAVDLNSPATTLSLLRLNALVGVTGIFDRNGRIASMGIQCALCHSTVDNSLAPGIGHRLDGWANRDLNVGAIIALAPDLSAPAELLRVDQNTVRTVLNSWGPGKFDAELFLDGKPFRPDGRSAAVLIPPAFGLAGVNLGTWTGFGSTTYWNALVANLEMHGKGTFFDSRLSDALQFPVAARAGSNDTRNDPDLVTSKLAALHFYQLALPAPKRRPSAAETYAAIRGKALFDGRGAMFLLSLRNPDTTCTPRKKLGSTIFRLAGRRPRCIGHRHSKDYSRMRKAAFIRTAASQLSRLWSITTTTCSTLA
jgi:hypothetical protein